MVGRECHTNVLVVGAGPAGLLSACLLARFGNIDFRIIEKNPVKPKAGISDCIQSRTLEVLEAMGLQHGLDQRGYRIREYTFWDRDLNTGGLNRMNIGPDVISPTPFPWTLAVDKIYLEEALLNDLVSRGQNVEYNMEFLSSSGPSTGEQITVSIKNHSTGAIETWFTSFILACDGIDSTVRRSMEIQVDRFGDPDSWAVADVSATTDIPDYRRRCTIRSPSGQNCVITPRPASGYRIRTLLSKADLTNHHWKMTHNAKQVSSLSHVAGSMDLVNALQSRIGAAISPYTFVINEIAWICQYSRPKILARRFADPTLSVFLLGSASHTHSPLTKMSINGGMMDALNLTWKLALVVNWGAKREILSTYEYERRSLLEKAVEFDCKIDHIFSIKSNDIEVPQGFYDFEQASGYTSGCGARYPSGILIKEEKRVHLNKAIDPLTPGKRLMPGKVIRHIDGNDVDVLNICPPNGRFKLIYFAGSCLKYPIFEGLSNFLVSEDSPLQVKWSNFQEGNPIIDLVLIHTSSHINVLISDLPEPWPQYKLSIFEDVGGMYHSVVGISRSLGGLCLVRPDGHVAIVSNLDNSSAVTDYFEKLLPLESLDILRSTFDMN